MTAVALILFMSALFVSSIKGTRQEYSKTEFMLDTECSVTVYGNSKKAKSAVEAAFEKISEIESYTSMYIENSDVSKINSAKSNIPINVDNTTFEILKLAAEVAEKSSGAFDITVSPVKELWNFKSAAAVPSDEEIAKQLKNVGYNQIVLDENFKTVTKLNSDVKIDLGGIAKGYCGDAAKEVLKEYDIECGIVDLGGNITVFGTNPNSEDGKWGIGIQIPFEPTGSFKDVVRVNDLSVVSSGNYERYFEYKGKIYHHILDPCSGYPADNGFNQVTIIHESSALSDALSTACYVLGREKGEELAKSYGAEIYFN